MPKQSFAGVLQPKLSNSYLKIKRHDLTNKLKETESLNRELNCFLQSNS